MFNEVSEQTRNSLCIEINSIDYCLCSWSFENLSSTTLILSLTCRLLFWHHDQLSQWRFQLAMLIMWRKVQFEVVSFQFLMIYVSYFDSNQRYSSQCSYALLQNHLLTYILDFRLRCSSEHSHRENYSSLNLILQSHDHVRWVASNRMMMILMMMITFVREFFAINHASEHDSDKDDVQARWCCLSSFHIKSIRVALSVSLWLVFLYNLYKVMMNCNDSLRSTVYLCMKCQ